MSVPIFQVVTSSTNLDRSCELTEVISDPTIVALDVECTFPTGPWNQRYVVEISIVSCHEVPYYHSLVNPGLSIGNRFKHKGITDSRLTWAPSLPEVFSQIIEVIRGKHLISWGIIKDIERMTDNMPDPPQARALLQNAIASSSCIMHRYAAYDPLWRPSTDGNFTGNFHWRRMKDAYKKVGYPDLGPIYTHRSTADAVCALGVWQWMEAHPLPIHPALGGIKDA